MENIFVEFLPPWIETGLQPAFYDKESGTVLQQTARMYARVNMLIRMFNKLSKNTKTTVEDYINQFNELHDYVHDYFDNLDVQEEINNKLDAMAEAGTLQEIIAEYLSANALWCYDTVADMMQATNLISGSYAKTLGHYSKEDGLGAYYKIDTTGEIALSNGLYATVVENPGGNNYYELSSSAFERYNTTCYVTTIPLNDSDNNQINPYVTLIKDKPSKYAQNENTSFTINASLAEFSVISNGEIVQNKDVESYSLPDSAIYLALKADRTLVDYQANHISCQVMQNDGAIQAWLAYYPLIKNNVVQDFDAINADWADYAAAHGWSEDVATVHHPRQCIGQKANKDIVILTTDGRRPGDVGLTSAECATILQEYGCVNAWNLDGGGSTSTVINGYKINRNLDHSGTVERNIDAVLSVKRQTIDKELGMVNSQIGKVVNENNKNLIELINQSIVESAPSNDLNTLVNKQYVNYVVGGVNTPGYTSGYFVNIPIARDDLVGDYSKQIFMDRRNGRMYTRSKHEGVFTSWVPTDGYKAYLFDRGTTPFTLSTNGDYELYQFSSNENTLVSSTPSYIDFISIDPEDNTKLIFNGTSEYAHVTISFEITSVATNSNRVFRALTGGSTATGSHGYWKNSTTDYGIKNHTMNFVCRTNVPLQFQFLGSEGDTIKRMSIYAESMY